MLVDDAQHLTDDLNQVGVLRRREIEARIVGPLLERIGAEFRHERVRELAAEVIIDLARRQGAAMAQQCDGDTSLTAFAAMQGAWTADGALESELVELSDDVFAFNVTRCRYAEMYRSLGLEELGSTLSCNRDATLIEGFNPAVRFSRTRTIMSGATHCDFVYRVDPTA